MGQVLNDSVGRATSASRSIGVLPKEADSIEGIEATLTGKTKKEARKEGYSSFLNKMPGGIF